jgi:hypothetical protein
MSYIKAFKIIGYKFIIWFIISLLLLFIIDLIIFNFESNLFDWSIIIILLIIFNLHLSKSVSIASGWKILSIQFGTYREYRIELPETIIPFYGFINHFKYPLRLSFNSNGIILKVILLFRFGHQNLSIPWSAISKIIIRNVLNTERRIGNIERLSLIGSNAKYGELKLKNFKDIKIELPWTDEFEKSIPEHIHIEMKD